MKNLVQRAVNRLERCALRAKCAAQNLLTDERGDTNFLSIAIILVVVITVAVVFIGFKDQILGWFQTAIGDLESAITSKGKGEGGETGGAGEGMIFGRIFKF